MVSFPVQGNERGARLGVWEWEGRERSGRRAGVCNVGAWHLGINPCKNINISVADGEKYTQSVWKNTCE